MTSLEDSKLQKRTFKAHFEKSPGKFKDGLKVRIEKKREINLKKLNKIRVKTKKI
jgi:hypothetical protein